MFHITKIFTDVKRERKPSNERAIRCLLWILVEVFSAVRYFRHLAQTSNHLSSYSLWTLKSSKIPMSDLKGKKNLGRLIEIGYKALVKRHVIVDESWFSPNYHQQSPTIVQMVKRPKKFVIADDSSPAVVQAKSREQRVPSSFRVKMRILNGPVRQTC